MDPWKQLAQHEAQQAARYREEVELPMHRDRHPQDAAARAATSEAQRLSDAVRQAGRQEAEEAAHTAWAERVEIAAVSAAQILLSLGRPVARLARVRKTEKTKVSARGDWLSTKTWYEIERDFGHGWLLYTDVLDVNEGDTYYTTVSLTDDGRLLIGSHGLEGPEVKIGRKRPFVDARETVLSVGYELDPTDRGTSTGWNSDPHDQAVRRLEAELAKLSSEPNQQQYPAD